MTAKSLWPSSRCSIRFVLFLLLLLLIRTRACSGLAAAAVATRIKVMSKHNDNSLREVGNGGNNNERDSFIDALMSKMTMAEKIGQLNLLTSGDITTGEEDSAGGGDESVMEKIRQGNVGGLFNIKTAKRIRRVQEVAVEHSRLGIPLVFGMDVIHGYKTIFPIPLGLSCTWDMALIEQSARIAAQETSADGICWTFSPMVDISRDPRWGRVAEGSGEDPYLGSLIARAMVRGYQGHSSNINNENNNLRRPDTILACVKHMALYGASEAGRDYSTVDMSRVRMYNEYLPPYQAAIEEGARTVMTSFNEVDGIPASANRWLLHDLLREAWKFQGFVVTDYTAINEMVHHGIGDLAQVSAKALQAGVDMDMVGEGYLTTLPQSLQDGIITETQITQACRRILEAKYDLGLFDAPYQYCDPLRAENEISTSENRKIARDIAAQSLVLLKNQDQLLPLNHQDVGKIALIGPLADNRENMPGAWSVAADVESSVSLREGIEKHLQEISSSAEIRCARGCNIVLDEKLEQRISIFGKSTHRDNRSEEEMLAEAVALAEWSNVVVAAVGEAAEMSGECASRTDIELPATQRRLLEAVLKTGTPVVMILFTGRPMALTWEEEHVPCILNVWFPGSEAGHAIADVIFGTVNPSGKLTATFPQNAGQIPIYYNHKNTGRPLGKGQWFQKFRSNYLDVSNEPLYPFGYGLSYSKFEYENLVLDGTELIKSASSKDAANLKVEVEVSNMGGYDGHEIVQLYVRDVVGSITRPVKELKGFQKVFLRKGERQKVSFTLTERDLRFFDQEMNFVREPGDFQVFVGPNSRDVLEGRLWINR